MMEAIDTHLQTPALRGAGRPLAAARAWLAEELHRAVRESMDEGFLATEKGMRYLGRTDDGRR